MRPDPRREPDDNPEEYRDDLPTPVWQPEDMAELVAALEIIAKRVDANTARGVRELLKAYVKK